MTKEISAFGKKLQLVLTEKKMSDSDLAKKLNLSPSQIFMLKRSTRPRLKTLKKLSYKLKKPVEFWSDVIPSKKESLNQSEKLVLGKLKVYLIVEFNGYEERILLGNL